MQKYEPNILLYFTISYDIFGKRLSISIHDHCEFIVFKLVLVRKALAISLFSNWVTMSVIA